MIKYLFSHYKLNILLPVEKNIKFFFIYALLCSFYPLVSLFTDFTAGDTIGILLGISTSITWAYLGCLLISLAKLLGGKIFQHTVSIILYAVLFILLAFTLVVKYGFGRYMSAVEIQLVADTNINESREFISTFASDQTIIAILGG